MAQRILSDLLEADVRSCMEMARAFDAEAAHCEAVRQADDQLAPSARPRLRSACRPGDLAPAIVTS